MKTVCFTGHRSITDKELPRLKVLLVKEIERCVLSGATVFRAGGALGFDTLAAQAVLFIKEHYPSVRLELILPCKTQTRGWDEKDVKEYQRILDLSDAYEFLSEAYRRGVMHQRNRKLVDGADACIAFLREGASGGTAYTVSYAQKVGIPVINLATL